MEMGLLLAVYILHTGSTVKAEDTQESWRGEKAGMLQFTDPHSKWWSVHGLSAPSRAHFGAVRFYFGSLSTGLLLWQGWVFMELLGSFVLATGYLSWELFQPFCSSCQNAVRTLARLAAQAVAICVTIPFRWLNWTGHSHMGNHLQKVVSL